MGRRLPWKIYDGNEDGEKPDLASQSAEQTPALRPTSLLSRFPHRRSRKRGSELNFSDPVRSPSTSPPPEPPKEEFMIGGLGNDDQYRMVEDELLETAQCFTAHLHRAEYDRLKKKAKSHNAAAIHDMERPVVGPMTSAAKRRALDSQRLKRQQSLTSGLVRWGDPTGATRGATSLQGLLHSPRKEVRTLSMVSSESGLMPRRRGRVAQPVGSSLTEANSQSEGQGQLINGSHLPALLFVTETESESESDDDDLGR